MMLFWKLLKKKEMKILRLSSAMKERKKRESLHLKL